MSLDSGANEINKQASIHNGNIPAEFLSVKVCQVGLEVSILPKALKIWYQARECILQKLVASSLQIRQYP